MRSVPRDREGTITGVIRWHNTYTGTSNIETIPFIQRQGIQVIAR